MRKLVVLTFLLFCFFITIGQQNEDIILCKKFDLYNFLPVDEINKLSSDIESFCKVIRKNGSIIRIEFWDTKNDTKNYDFIVHHNKNIVLLYVNYYQSVQRIESFSYQGKIVIFLNQNKIYALTEKHISKTTFDLLSCDYDCIYLLNEKLEPVEKIVVDCNKVLYKSIISSHGEGITEQILYPLNKKICSSLESKIDALMLDELFSRDSFCYNFFATVRPSIPTNKYPRWFYPCNSFH